MNPTEAQKKARHTPGPWSKDLECIQGPSDENIASACISNERWKANAHLIASAPDMLLALRELLAIGEGGVIQRNETGKPTWSAMDEIKRIAGAAIAKAEGGAQ